MAELKDKMEKQNKKRETKQLLSVFSMSSLQHVRLGVSIVIPGK